MADFGSFRGCCYCISLADRPDLVGGKSLSGSQKNQEVNSTHLGPLLCKHTTNKSGSRKFLLASFFFVRYNPHNKPMKGPRHTGYLV